MAACTMPASSSTVLTESPAIPVRVAAPTDEAVLDFREIRDKAGILVETDHFSKPDQNGIILRKRVLLPEFTKACYYAPFQQHAIDPSLDLWPEGYNQCHPQIVRSLAEAKRGGFFLILHLTDGSYLCLLPMVSPLSMAWFRGDGGNFWLEAGHWGTEGWEGDLPVLGWARDRNLYRACEQVWRHALDHPLLRDQARPRTEKKYPEPFRYLGWCSWEEFKWDIGEDALIEAVRELDASSVPVRWVLFDDGHVDEGTLEPHPASANGQNGETPIHESDRRLVSLGVNQRRFPRGWKPVVNACRKTKIKWLGVWLNFNGYWGGIHPENLLGPINEALIETLPGTLQPAPSMRSSEAFYEAFIARQEREGFDFVKMDNQAKNVTFYRGQVPNAVKATMGNHHAMESAVSRHLESMINCMAHNNLCAFSTRHSEITRCSEDYKKGDPWRAKHHLNNSFANMLWLGQTVWGDHDMFHSSDPVAAAMMARSKAISGGPVYLSDRPSNINLDLVRPLCFEDGRLLQPLAPAAPTPESAFLDSYEDDDAYCVIAPLAHKCAALAAYNLTHPQKPVIGRLSASDYRWAGAMIQDGHAEWPLPQEGLLAYDVIRKRSLDLRLGDHKFRIESLGDEFFILCPIINGVAIIGREDKFLPPEGISSIARADGRVDLALHESGPILLWTERENLLPAFKGISTALGGGLWRLELPVRPEPATLTVSF